MDYMESTFYYILELCEDLNIDYLKSLVSNIEVLIENIENKEVK